MSFLMALFLFLHILGTAIIVGTWFYTMKTPTVSAGQFWGAVVMLISGLGLLGGLEMSGAGVNHVKIGIKLVILLVILVTSFIGWRKSARHEPVSTGLAHSVGGLALINAAIAVFW